MHSLKINNQTMENKITDHLVHSKWFQIFFKRRYCRFFSQVPVTLASRLKIICSESFNWVLILFFSAFIVLLSIQIHFCEELSIEIQSCLAQSSDFENLAEYPLIPAKTGVPNYSCRLAQFKAKEEMNSGKIVDPHSVEGEEIRRRQNSILYGSVSYLFQMEPLSYSKTG